MSAGSSNSSNFTEHDFTAYDNAAAAIYFILFIFIVPLNTLVIFVLLRFENRKSRLHFFILHLAIADLSVGIFTVLGDGIHSALYGAWYGGDVICRIWRYLKAVTIIVSNDLLIGLSVDRFLAVAFPMMVMKTGSKLYKALVVCSWLVAFVVAIFFLIYSEGYNGRDGGCFIDLPSTWLKPYIIVVTLFVYILPTVIITLCYIGITVVVWKKWKENLHLSELSKPGHADNKTRPVDTSQVFLSKAKMKSVKMTLVICLAFFLCWTPYFVITILSVFVQQSIGHGPNTVLGALYCLNSLCNPLVFILFNKEKFLPKRFCGKKNGAESSEEHVTTEEMD